MDYKHDFGTAGGTPVEITVPAGRWVYSWAAAAAASGTVVITENGKSAQPTITVLAGTPIGFTWPDPPSDRPKRLGEGSTLTFTNTAYFVVYA